MADLMTVKVVAERIAVAQDEPVEPVLRQLRLMLGKGQVRATTVPKSGVTAPNLFNEAGALIAAVLLDLDRMGLSSTTVQATAQLIPQGGGSDEAVAALADGTPYYFHIHLLPKYFRRAGDVQHIEFSPLSDSRCGSFARVVTIPLQGLLGNHQERDEMADMPLPPKVD